MTTELRRMTRSSRSAGRGESLDIMPEAFATARGVSGVSACALHVQYGRPALTWQHRRDEDREGKTLVACCRRTQRTVGNASRVTSRLPASTVRDDGPRHKLLGLSVGVILPDAPDSGASYTANHLRHEHIWLRLPARQHGGLHRECVSADSYAIVTMSTRSHRRGRTPLIIKRPDPDDVQWYADFRRSPKLAKDVDYEVDEKKRTISVLEPDHQVEDHLGRQTSTTRSTRAISFMHNRSRPGAVPARQEYVSWRRGAHRRRAHPDAAVSYNDGHSDRGQGVEVREEYQPATITLQNFFRL